MAFRTRFRSMPLNRIGWLRAVPRPDVTRNVIPFRHADLAHSATTLSRMGRNRSGARRRSPDRSCSSTASTSWPSIFASRLVASAACDSSSRCSSPCTIRPRTSCALVIICKGCRKS